MVWIHLCHILNYIYFQLWQLDLRLVDYFWRCFWCSSHRSLQCWNGLSLETIYPRNVIHTLEYIFSVPYAKVKDYTMTQWNHKYSPQPICIAKYYKCNCLNSQIHCILIHDSGEASFIIPYPFSWCCAFVKNC